MCSCGTAFCLAAVVVAFRALYCWLADRRQSWVAKPRFASRWVSCVHAAALVSLSLARGWVPEGAWFAAARVIPIGYLIHDTHLILTEPALWDAGMVGHHALFATLVGLVPPRYGSVVAQAFLAEIPVLFLHPAWAMLVTGTHERRPAEFVAVSLSLLGTYLYFRVYALARIAVEAYGNSDAILYWPLVAVVALNWYWFAQLLVLGAGIAGGVPRGSKRSL